MKESIHKYFKVGTIQWMSFPRMDGSESLKAICRDDFFDAVEINTNKLGNVMDEAKALLEQSHLKVYRAHQGRQSSAGRSQLHPDSPYVLGREGGAPAYHGYHRGECEVRSGWLSHKRGELLK